MTPDQVQPNPIEAENDRLMGLLSQEVDAFVLLAEEGAGYISSMGGRRLDRVRFIKQGIELCRKRQSF